MKARKMFRSYHYGVRFLVATDGNTFVHQLHLPANGLPGELLTCRIAWIRLSKFYLVLIPAKLKGGPEGL